MGRRHELESGLVIDVVVQSLDSGMSVEQATKVVRDDKESHVLSDATANGTGVPEIAPRASNRVSEAMIALTRAATEC